MAETVIQLPPLIPTSSGLGKIVGMSELSVYPAGACFVENVLSSDILSVYPMSV